MPFPNSHYYLTFHWTDAIELLEAGQVGIRFDAPVNSSSQAVVDACKAAAQTFWTSAGAAIPGTYILKYLRLAAIGTDGRYVPGSIAYDGVYGSTVAGNAAGSGNLPRQIACASSLLSSVPRGQASKGRIYLPPLSSALGGDARWTQTAVNGRSLALATMLTSLNTAIQAPATIFSKGTVKSSVGSKHVITGVKTGSRPDVQRRRAKQVLEVYGTTSSV